MFNSISIKLCPTGDTNLCTCALQLQKNTSITIWQMLENVNCPKSLIRNCQGKWKSDHGSISGIASTPKFKHFQRVTLCPCLTSFVYIHQRVHELPCRETDIHRHTHTHWDQYMLHFTELIIKKSLIELWNKRPKIFVPGTTVTLYCLHMFNAPYFL